MATVLFTKRGASGDGFDLPVGNVVSFQDPTMPSTVMFRMEGWEGFNKFKAIITTVSLSAAGNVQFQHSLGGNIYVYVFGDRIGTATVSGLAFEHPCDNSEGTVGIEHVMNYYVENRVANRQTPIKLTIGSKRAIQGYLVSFNAQMLDPKTRIYQFTMQFMVPPRAALRCTRIASTPAALPGGTSATIDPSPLPDVILGDPITDDTGYVPLPGAGEIDWAGELVGVSWLVEEDEGTTVYYGSLPLPGAE